MKEGVPVPCWPPRCGVLVQPKCGAACACQCPALWAATPHVLGPLPPAGCAAASHPYISWGKGGSQLHQGHRRCLRGA
jgi:hypothetical protein